MEADELLVLVAGGDQKAFEDLYGLVSGPVFGLVRRVVRDTAQSEEVAQEVLLELWRSAARFDPGRGSALSWILTLAHRRAVDRVRSARAATEREQREGSARTTPPSTRSPRRWRPGWNASGYAAAWTGSPPCNDSPSPSPTTTATPTVKSPSGSPCHSAPSRRACATV